MRILAKLVIPAVALLSISGQAAADEVNLRGELLGSAHVSALYSVDDHTTLIKASSVEEAGSALNDACSAAKGVLTSGEGYLHCEGVFQASRMDSPGLEGTSFLIKTEQAQPLAYKNPYIPSIEEVAAPPGGRIAGEWTSVDIYQYMYALCKKENGTPSVIVSKRAGKTARYTEVSAEEAFSQLLAGEGKDPWFFACEGEKRFIVEKDYQYNAKGSSSFYFHPKRGLEWVDYVKADSDKVACLTNR